VSSSRAGGWRLGTVWLLSVLSLMTASTAIPMLIWLGSFTLMRDGVRRALVLTLPPMTVYAAWFVVWGNEADIGIEKAPLADVLPIAWRGMSATWDTMSGFVGAGPVIVVGLLSASVVLRPGTDRRTLALSGWLAAVSSYVIFAYSRGTLGADAATASRYAYFGALLMLPSLALVLDAARERLQVRATESWLTVTVVLGLLVVPGVFGVIDFRKMREGITPDLQERVIAASQLARSGQRLLREQVDPVSNPTIAAAELQPHSVAARLPGGPVSPRARLTASAALQVGTSATSYGLPEAKASFVSTDTTPSGDCEIGLGVAGSTLEVPSGTEGAQVRLILGTDRTTVRLRDAGTTSLPVELMVGDGSEVYLGVTAPGVDLLVDLPLGTPFTVCGRGGTTGD
jgi:hypothetical protein